MKTGGLGQVCRQVAFLLLCFGLTAGCQKTEEKKSAPEYLPRTHASHDSELKDWLSRLKADSALPHQLDALRVGHAPSEQSFAGLIQKIDSTDKTDTQLISNASVVTLLKDLKEIFPDQRVLPESISLTRLKAQLNHYRGKIDRVHQSLNRPFDPFVWKNTRGLLADSGYVSRCEALGGLEIMNAVVAIKHDRLAKAIESLRYCGKILRHLTSDHRLISRLTAVQLRNLWLQTVAHVVNHPKSEKKHLEEIYQLLRLQMAQWPNEKKIWVADRALGLHTYEMVRDGDYKNLLSEDEYNELEQKGLTNVRIQNVEKNVDTDQVFYLNVMGQLINKMDSPFHLRHNWLTKLESKHEQMRLKAEYPRIALDLLLGDIKNAQYRIAKDRSRCEAWMLAIGTSLGKNVKQFNKSESSGGSLTAGRIQGSISVSGLSKAEFSLAVRCPVRIK